MIAELTLAEMKSLTFQELDRQKGFVPQLPDVPSSGPTYAEQQYASLYKKPFGDMTDDDLSFITTHQWHPEYFVPLSLICLLQNPFAGPYYEGQLLLNVGRTPSQFWYENPVLREDFCHILGDVLLLIKMHTQNMDDKDLFLDEDTQKSIFELHKNLVCR